MLEKILKRLGYIKVNTEDDIEKAKEKEQKSKIEQLSKDFTELMSYNLKMSARDKE